MCFTDTLGFTPASWQGRRLDGIRTDFIFITEENKIPGKLDKGRKQI